MGRLVHTEHVEVEVEADWNRLGGPSHERPDTPNSTAQVSRVGWSPSCSSSACASSS